MSYKSSLLNVFVIFFLALGGLNAQVVQLKWSAPMTVLDSNFKPAKVLHFHGSKNSKENLLPYYELHLYNTAVANFKLISTTYKPLSENERLVLKNKSIPTDISVKIGIQNKLPYSRITFVPIRINPVTGVYEKLISFSYQYEKSYFSPEQYVASKNQQSGIGNPSKSGKIAAVSGSVLATGLWYKMAVNTTGIYKIDYNYLVSMGINPSFINPNYLRIHGNEGGMLPQPNSISRADDLQENAIFIAGAGDGKFDVQDYILFYAKGPDSWSYNTSESIFNHSNNLYSDKNYYFLTIGSALGKRIQDQSGLGSAAQSIKYFDDYVAYEVDNINLITSGRNWYGETISANSSASFSFNSSGILPGSTVKLTSSVIGRSTSPTSFSLNINNVFNTNLSISINNHYQYAPAASGNRTISSVSSNALGNPSSIVVRLTYNGSGVAVGNLDYLELNFRRKLALYGKQTSFRTLSSTSAATTQYYVDNAKFATIWKITDLTAIKDCQVDLVIGDTAVFSDLSSSLEEYVVFSGSNFQNPEYIGTVANQNLHFIGTTGIPDMVIVTTPEFLTPAFQLAAFRKNHDNLDVRIVTTEQIYNEFSSGRQDVTAIRDFMKMLFDRGVPGVDSLRYLLLFGDCSYDYKNRIAGNTNFVPVYQSRESFEPLASFSSDDYFGFLDDSEGNWLENPTEDNYLDIGVGRIPVKNVSEAFVAVEKLIHYSSSLECIGKWRNKITFTSDDGDGNLHIADAESLSIFVDTTYKNYNISKVFLDAFPQVPTPGGEKAPEVNAKIIEEVNAGTLILNYSGHGGETGLAQESVIDIPQIEAWNNYNAMPFLITATCDFGRYDDPLRSSGAEVSLIRSGGGSIGVLASTRVVFANSNFDLNEAIYDCIFEPVNGEMPRLGDVTRLSKNNSIVGVNNRNYALLGDPSLRLSYPKNSVVITKINDSVVSVLPDTIKALSKVKIEGEIRNSSGVLQTTFNGDVIITVYDKKASVSTYGTQGDSPYLFGIRNNYLFNGKASVINGLWSISFVVPKDISYQYDFGKISAYAYRYNTLRDAAGHYSTIIIGGTDPNAPADNLPPRIKLFMNDESFVFGGLTEKDAMFLAKLTDENGINTSGSGVGHEIAATLDNDEKPLVLNQYYSSKLNDYKNGSVKYPYKDLSPGPHSIKLKVWDTYNNSSEAILEFIVASNLKIALSHILNYPNPFSSHTVFHFDHNRAGDDLDVMIQIYTVSGKLVKTLDSKVYGSSSHFMGLDWDGKDDFGDKIGKGVYVYRVWVRTPRDGSSAYKYEKLVILN